METAYKCCLISKLRRSNSRRNTAPPPPPEDIVALFSLHAGGAPHVGEDALHRCLGAYQGGEGGGELESEGLLDNFHRIPRQQLFTLDDFHRILFSDNINPPIRHRHVHHDMTLPLSHYFIYSSHNPYYATPPAGQQHGGGRSDEPIIRALKMGVRAIEVAMWPNSKWDDINIHHGWTENTPVLLAECLKSIKEYAFVASPYPVIITLEDNLPTFELQKKAAKVRTVGRRPSLSGQITLEDNLPTSELQKKAAKVVLDVLGDILYWPHTYHVDVRGNADTTDPLKEFPSPQELKGRVLLSTKPPSPVIVRKGKTKPSMEVDGSKVDERTTEQGDAAAAWGEEVPDFQTEDQPAKKHDGDGDVSSGSLSGHQRLRNDENGYEDQKEQKMQPHEYLLYRHLFTIIPEKQKAIERVSTLQTSKTIKRVSTLQSEPPEVSPPPPLSLPHRSGVKTNKTIERVSTLQSELPGVPPPPPLPLLRRGGLKTNRTIERVSTSENEPGKVKKVLFVDALHSEPGKVRRLSWSKQQIEKAAKDRGTDVVRFTQRNILRIYPSFSTKDYPRGTHLITSSNYNPFLGWVHGAQMAALNLQEYGRALWLLHGFYRANGGCGYEYGGRDLSLMHGFRRACRPADLVMQTEPAEVFDPTERQPVKKTLKVKVYMGDGWLMDFKHAHTSFIPDLWTSVGIAGVPADTTAMQNTKATERTWVPVWEDEFSFDLTVPEIALLRVEVHQYDVSEKDVFGGQTVLPVWELRPGIRAVPLFDRQGNRFHNARLLMRFQFVPGIDRS